MRALYRLLCRSKRSGALLLIMTMAAYIILTNHVINLHVKRLSDKLTPWDAKHIKEFQAAQHLSRMLNYTHKRSASAVSQENSHAGPIESNKTLADVQAAVQNALRHVQDIVKEAQAEQDPYHVLFKHQDGRKTLTHGPTTRRAQKAKEGNSYRSSLLPLESEKVRPVADADLSVQRTKIDNSRLPALGSVESGKVLAGEAADSSVQENRKENSRVPALGSLESGKVLLAGVPRQYRVYLAIGMVTVRRDKANYFFETLASLLAKSSREEKRELTIVVMLADRDQAYNDHVLARLTDSYPTQLQDGLLLVVRKANTDFLFKDLDIKRTYNDSLTRVRWRSKQNLDYAALIEFCASLCQYYLHLEDDVTAAQAYIQRIREFIQANNHRTWAMLEIHHSGREPGTAILKDDVTAVQAYIQRIREFIQANNHRTWAMLEMSPHGFIGKLFRSRDLPKLVMVLRAFYLEQPCDFLIKPYFINMMTQAKPIVRSKALFYHRGQFSSLKNVTRKVDKIPGAAGSKTGNSHQLQKEPVKKHKYYRPNPEAVLSTDMAVYATHELSNAYNVLGREFFWTSDVHKDKSVTIVFDSPQTVRRIVVETGFSDENRRDFLHNASVLCSVDTPGEGDYRTCPDAQSLGNFSRGRFDATMKTSKDINCISILVNEEQDEWLVIREIVVYTS